MDIPKEWTFHDTGVASEFDSHVREQLPWYDLVTSAVAHIARHYIPDNGLVYDIGSSTGNVSRSLADCIHARKASLVAIDNSQEMVSRYQGLGTAICADAMSFEYENFDVAILFLLLMFLPVSERKDFVNTLYRRIKPGGALIIVDKVSIPQTYLSTVLHRLTIAGKVSAGCSASDIIAKELSLAGVQRPLPNHFPHGQGLTGVEFFRFGEFAGWVIEGPTG